MAAARNICGALPSMMMKKVLSEVICSEVGLVQKPDLSCLRAGGRPFQSSYTNVSWTVQEMASMTPHFQKAIDTPSWRQMWMKAPKAFSEVRVC